MADEVEPFNLIGMDIRDQAPNEQMDFVTDLLVQIFGDAPMFFGVLVNNIEANPEGSTFMTFTNTDIAQMGEVLRSVSEGMLGKANLN